jgi:NNP family nitrate/nitrite transporter-like MFS transporter
MLLVFARMDALGMAVATLIVFGLFTHMAAGATYALVPFVRRDAVGAVAGIIGAGGNLGAVAAGFLFRSDSFAVESALLVLGAVVTVSAFLVLAVRFPAAEAQLEVLPQTAGDASSNAAAAE